MDRDTLAREGGDGARTGGQTQQPPLSGHTAAAGRVAGAARETARCADQLVALLQRSGIDTVYGVPGGAISPIYDALIDHPSIRVIHVRHETNALFMAIGQTRLQPEALPCVLVTSGPGLTNAVTGLAAASGESVPVLVLGGEVPLTKFGRNALQEGGPEALDTLAIVRSVTRSAERVLVPGQATFQLASAMHRARTERGPVFLSLPLDVAVAPTPSLDPPWRYRPRLLPDPSAIVSAADAIRGARSPLLLLGSGARGAAVHVRALAEQLNLPTMTSPKAKGIVPETARHCLGVFGHGGHPSAFEWLRKHPPDVVLALGCGFGETSTNSWSPQLQASRTMIQVDLDARRLGRNYRVDLGIEADCADVIALLCDELEDCKAHDLPLDGLTFLDPDATRDDRSPLGPARVLSVLQEQMPPNTVYTSDIGEHLFFAIHYLRVSEPDQFIAALGVASMGSGIGSAIGAKLAAPTRSVVAICGDYGFQMYGMELNTCVQEELPVIFLVMNDGRMRMVESGLERIYGRALPMTGPRVDFAAIARAHGACGIEVEDSRQLAHALQHVSKSGPTVLDVRIDPRAAFPVNARVADISHFTSESRQAQ